MFKLGPEVLIPRIHDQGERCRVVLNAARVIWRVSFQSKNSKMMKNLMLQATSSPHAEEDRKLHPVHFMSPPCTALIQSPTCLPHRRAPLPKQDDLKWCAASEWKRASQSSLSRGESAKMFCTYDSYDSDEGMVELSIRDFWLLVGGLFWVAGEPLCRDVCVCVWVLRQEFAPVSACQTWEVCIDGFDTMNDTSSGWSQKTVTWPTVYAIPCTWCGQDPEQNLEGCGLSHFHKLCQLGGLGQELLLCWVSILDYFQIMHLNFWIINFQQTQRLLQECMWASFNRNSLQLLVTFFGW